MAIRVEAAVPAPTLVILDPTSLIGREVAAEVAARFPEWRRQFFHTGTDDEHLIAEVANDAALVAPLRDLDDLEHAAVVVATASLSAELGARLAPWLAAHPRIAFIAAGHSALPFATAVACDRLPRLPAGQRWLRLVDPMLAAPARVLAALAPLTPEFVALTVIRPAAAFGEEALDELAAESAARLSGSAVRPPAALPVITALDIVAGNDAVLAEQITILAAPAAAEVTVLEAGIFHGHVATLVVELARPASAAAVRRALRSASGVRLSRPAEVVSATRVIGSVDVICTSVRVSGRHVVLVIAADGIRLGGANAVTDLIAALMAA